MQANYLRVPTIYVYQLFTCTNYLRVPTIYVYQLFTCTNYLRVPTIYVYQLFTCTLAGFQRITLVEVKTVYQYVIYL